MSNCINVTSTTKETVEIARKSILEIINSSNSEQVKITALETFKDICKVSNVNITNCNFTLGKNNE